MVVGDFSHVSTVVSTQANQWFESDTNQMVDVTSPDNVLVSGRLVNGAVASAHVASNPWVDSGYLMEIHGREGTLIATSDDTPNHQGVSLRGSRGSDPLEDLPVPPQYTFVLEGMPHGAPYCVGQMYYQFGEAIRNGTDCQPDFDEAVRLHRLDRRDPSGVGYGAGGGVGVKFRPCTACRQANEPPRKSNAHTSGMLSHAELLSRLYSHEFAVAEFISNSAILPRSSPATCLRARQWCASAGCPKWQSLVCKIAILRHAYPRGWRGH